MSDTPENGPEPPNLRFLRRLVTTLTVVMIGGVITIVTLLVIRLTEAPAALALPDTLTLPDGTTPTAVTLTGNRLLVVTDDDRLLVYDTDGALRQTVVLE
ncbi:DUF6476 family protein [Aestuariibius sp. 2305UL40-4]|uniref:DUF6476 family protein n=1 Tax=Aestuariibius violaceus TaxID=3234132 RepID=UPI00345E61A9